MASIVNTTLVANGTLSVTATTVINWDPADLNIDYMLEYRFWEDDPRHDDDLRFAITRSLPAPHSGTQTDRVVIGAQRNWNNEWGKDEIYARVRLIPDPSSVPQTVRATTNVVSRHW